MTTKKHPESPPPELPRDQVLLGDCREVLASLPERCIDLIFADPPYHMQRSRTLWRPHQTPVAAGDPDWDRFASFADYDAFTRTWLQGCQRVLKDTGTLWVMGTFHNIHRVGTLLQDLGFWILNEVVYEKTNAMPNFRGVRLCNAHETLLWVKKSPRQKRYTFHYQTGKQYHGGKQLRSVWRLPVCRGRERLTWQGVKAHPTQKPEALLERVILLSSHPGDLVLDPFFGTGTTGAVCQRFHRHWIGIEREPRYGELARQRIAHVTPLLPGLLPPDESPRDRPRVPFRALLDAGLLHPGDPLSFCCSAVMARVEADGTLTLHGQRGSLHQMGAAAAHQPTCNGWEHWYYQDEAGEWQPLNRLREEVRRRRTGGPVSGPPGEGHSGSRE
jgi:DNA modification methylase